MKSSEQTGEKINPFRELPRPRAPQLDTEKKSSPTGGVLQNKEITITLNPRKLGRGLLMAVLLLGVFFAGRLSAGDASFSLPDFSLPDFSEYFSPDTGPSGLATGNLTKQNETEQNKTAEAQLAENEATVNETETESEAPEKVISDEYTQVTLSLDGVYKDWKGTWGKIKGVKYTITNNEAGTIKPHHFTMMVEGYEDVEKYFEVSYSSQKVKAGQSLSDEAAVSGGFAYSPLSIPDGDLSHVRISLFLFDADGDTIASTHQEVDLSG